MTISVSCRRSREGERFYILNVEAALRWHLHLEGPFAEPDVCAHLQELGLACDEIERHIASARARMSHAAQVATATS